MIDLSLTETIDWEKISSLVPAIIQNDITGAVLMLGYLNQEALQKTLETGEVHFWSRTKKTTVEKGRNIRKHSSCYFY